MKHPRPRASCRRAVALALALVASGCGNSRSRSHAQAEGVAPVALRWTDTARPWRDAVGRTVAVQCPGARATAQVFGTDVYADESSVCTAALHAGRISLVGGGTFSVEIRPGADGYAATLRNGVASATRAPSTGASFALVGGPAPGLAAIPLGTPAAPAPADDAWARNASADRERVGEALVHECPPGGTPGPAWGTVVYTDDSSICAAAVHAGRSSVERGGRVTYFVLPGRPVYFGSRRFGVTSLDHDAARGSFAFERDAHGPESEAPPGVRAINWSTNAVPLRGRAEAESVFCVPGGAFHSVWGTGVYTDDSSICTAAVHAGKIDHAVGGAVTVRPSAGRPRYRGSTAHGVSATDYGAFGGSFSFER